MTQETMDRIKTYSKPSAQQRLLIELDAKPTKTPDDMKKIKALMAAEVAAEKAAAAKVAASGVLREIAKAEATAIRSARTHELCESAGLMALAGLVDKVSGKPTRDLGELLGGLLNLASISDPAILGQWKRKGDAMLAGKPQEAARESKPVESTPRPAPTPPAAPDMPPVPTAAAPVCPDCGKPMAKRSSARGEFWGCSGFPACKGSRSV